MRLLVVSVMAFAMYATPAHAADANDLAIAVAVTPGNTTIVSGTEVTFTVKVTNVGSSSIAAYLSQVVVLSPSLTYKSVTSSESDFECPSHAPIEEYDKIHMDSRYDNHTLILCGSHTDARPTLAPDGYFTYTITATANSNFVNGSTKALFVNLLWNNESEYSRNNDALEASFTQGGDPATLDTNNVTTYTYSAPSASNTSGSNNSTSDNTQSSANNSSSNGTTEVKGKTDTNNEANGSTSGENLAGSVVDKKISDDAEIAVDVRNFLPKRISQADEGQWQAIMNGRYRSQIIGTSLVLGLAGILAYFLRRRYLSKASLEKEYRKALKIMDHK